MTAHNPELSFRDVAGGLSMLAFIHGQRVAAAQEQAAYDAERLAAARRRNTMAQLALAQAELAILLDEEDDE
jgi:hypothetical protein